MTRRSVAPLWALAVVGLLVGAFLLVLGLATLGDDTSRTSALVLVALGILVLAGAGWQVGLLRRHRRAVTELRGAHADLRQAVTDAGAGSPRSGGPVHSAAPPVQGYGEPAREVRSWHLVVAWLVALAIIAIGLFFVVGGVVGLSGGTNRVVGLLLAAAGGLILWGAAVYVRGVVRSQQAATRGSA